MANFAYQITNFAYQGDDAARAYQGNSGGVVAAKTGTGGIDPSDGRKRIIKPLGILRLPKKKGGHPEVEARLQDSQDVQTEIAARLAREFSEESAGFAARPQLVEMSLSEVDAEIGRLLRKKLRTEEDEVILLMLMAASTV